MTSGAGISRHMAVMQSSRNLRTAGTEESSKETSGSSTPWRRWSHAGTETTSATRGSSLWGDSESPQITIHAVPFLCQGAWNTLHASKNADFFAEFSPRLHCHVAQYMNSNTLWFPLQRQVLLVRVTLLVCYSKREKEVAIQLHENLHSHDTYSLSRVLSLC